MTGEKLSGAPPRASGAAAVLTRQFDGQWVAISAPPSAAASKASAKVNIRQARGDMLRLVVDQG